MKPRRWMRTVKIPMKAMKTKLAATGTGKSSSSFLASVTPSAWGTSGGFRICACAMAVVSKSNLVRFFFEITNYYYKVIAYNWMITLVRDVFFVVEIVLIGL